MAWSTKVKEFARRNLPDGLSCMLRHIGDTSAEFRIRLHLARMRRKTWLLKYGSQARCLSCEMRITDGPNFYMQYKDEFIHQIYHFAARRPDPLIIDGGSNIGMSILYFSHIYPAARIIGFEPDPAIFLLLRENVTRNKLQKVTLINAGLGAESGTALFSPDGSAGGHFEGEKSGTMVRVDRLSDYLDDPVDFLKLNIEGQELPVLQEAESSGKLGNVRELVLEYHGWASGEQRLGTILNLLDRQGFRYLVHDFDAESCRTSKPPFNLTPQSTWFCLIYARRMSD